MKKIILIAFLLTLAGCASFPGDSYTLTLQKTIKNLANQPVQLLTFNKSFPGPMITIVQDSTIALTINNELNTPFLLHPHGVRTDNAFDGTHLTQEPILPDDSFTYSLSFPDPGMYWYHPHLREDFGQEFGLYGVFIVTPKVTDYWSPVNQEEILIIDDILLDRNGIADFPQDFSDHALSGRFGNTMLINGQPDYQLTIPQKSTIRFFILNAANTRVFNLSMPGAKLKLVGGDNGRIEHEKWVDSLVISPSERYVVETIFAQAGAYPLLHRTPKKEYQIGTITVTEENASPDYSSSFQKKRSNTSDYETLRKMIAEKNLLNTTPDKSLRIDIDMMGMGMMQNHRGMRQTMKGVDDAPEKIEWEDDMSMMNRMATSENTTWMLMDTVSKQSNDKISWDFKNGSLVKIRIFNDPKTMHPMQHPIHIHGQRFVVLAINGNENIYFQWKDTVLIRTGDTVDLLVEMNNPGIWMLHCHIPEHLESGMGLPFSVL